MWGWNKHPDYLDDLSFCHQFGQGLKERIIGEDASHFDRLLLKLFTQGMRSERRNAMKELTGARCVYDYLHKMDNWVERDCPPQLPRFTRNELSAVRDIYLPRPQREKIRNYERNSISRRYFLKDIGDKTKIMMGLAGLSSGSFIARSRLIDPDDDPTYEEYRQAHRKAISLEEAKDQLNKSLQTFHLSAKPEALAAIREQCRQGRRAWQEAQNALLDAGFPTYNKAKEDHLFWSTSLLGSGIFSGVILFGMMGAEGKKRLNDFIYGMDGDFLYQNDNRGPARISKEQYQDILKGMHRRLQKVARHLDQGIEPLMREIATQVDRQNYSGQDEGQSLS